MGRLHIGRRLLRLPEKPLEGVPHGYSLASSWLIRLTNRIAEALERVLLWSWTRQIAIDRPIFVVGPYRSGTTILEQIIAAHADVAHFWYLTNVYSRSPVTGYGMAHLLRTLGVLDGASVLSVHNPRISFTMLSPYECEWVWSQSEKSLWDERCTDLTVGSEFSDPRFERYLRSMIRRHILVQRATRFVNKNPVNCLRIGYLHRLFPDARFVTIVRHPVDTVLSHHRAAARMRRVVYADARVRRTFQVDLHIDILSMCIKTRTYAQTLALDQVHPLLGIANQWKDLQTEVLDSIDREPGLGERVLPLCYEDLVSQPAHTLERVWRFVELHGEQADAITRAYADRLTPPPALELDVQERALLPRVWEIAAPVAARLGYSEPGER